MKRSEMVEKIYKTYNNATWSDELMTESMANKILVALEESGMLPPLNTVKIIPDPTIPGQSKHTETKHEWDPEEN